jgi:hypothetical protein
MLALHTLIIFPNQSVKLANVLFLGTSQMQFCIDFSFSLRHVPSPHPILSHLITLITPGEGQIYEAPHHILFYILALLPLSQMSGLQIGLENGKEASLERATP